MSGTNYGILLKMGDGSSPEVFTTIGELSSIEPPALTHVVEEATTHDSSGWRTYIGTGLRELEEFTCMVNLDWSDDTHDWESGLASLVLSGASNNFQLVFPDTRTWTFGAIVVSIAPEEADATSPEVLKAEITFQPTGATTMGEGSYSL
jgi:hypothetical protein